MKTLLQKGLLIVFITVALAFPALAQELYQVTCTGTLYGSSTIIQGTYYLSKVFDLDDREVRFEGTIASNHYGNGQILIHDYYSSHPFDGQIISSHETIPIRVWEYLDARSRSASWEIQENNGFRAGKYVGKLFCQAR